MLYSTARRCDIIGGVTLHLLQPRNRTRRRFRPPRDSGLVFFFCQPKKDYLGIDAYDSKVELGIALRGWRWIFCRAEKRRLPRYIVDPAGRLRGLRSTRSNLDIHGLHLLPRTHVTWLLWNGTGIKTNKIGSGAKSEYGDPVFILSVIEYTCMCLRRLWYRSTLARPSRFPRPVSNDLRCNLTRRRGISAMGWMDSVGCSRKGITGVFWRTTHNKGTWNEPTPFCFVFAIWRLRFIMLELRNTRSYEGHVVGTYI